ncbi:MAG: Ig-like domain-containing protein, partial [Arenimonas sp.]
MQHSSGMEGTPQHRRERGWLHQVALWCLLLWLPAIAWAQAAPNAEFVSQIVPAAMAPGQQYAVTVRMKNTGGYTWDPGGSYYLVLANRMDFGTWGLMGAGPTVVVYPGGTGTFNFTVQAPSSPGVYNLQMRMSDNTYFGDLTPKFAVAVDYAPPPPPNVPPSISLTSPTNGATGTAPASFALTANATDSDGTISKVEFYDSYTLIATDTAAPYTYTYPGLLIGSYSLSAKATDNSGATTTSSAVTVTSTTTNPRPTITLTAPVDGASNGAPGTFSLSATASSSNGSISNVDFFVGYTRVAVVTSPPYTYTQSGLAAGTYQILARAWDNVGQFTNTPVTTVTVTSAPPNAPPTVSLTSPSAGATAFTPGSFNLAAAATDSDGTISQVAFYSNGSLVYTDIAAPYACTYASVPAGSYSLTAKATDNAGATTTSSAVSVTVTSAPNVAPSVALTSPSS